jgi:hypothetical protein
LGSRCLFLFLQGLAFSENATIIGEALKT